jgi:6-phosphogluconolactonase
MDRSKLEEQLATTILQALTQEIERNGRASLLVSGGSTPKGLFVQLAKADIPWQQVTISLVDERYLPDGHPDQNGTMVKKLLLQEFAAKAKFQPLVMDATDAQTNLALVNAEMRKLPRPFTVVVLGMGGDGHTASLFPDAPELDSGMDLTSEEDIILTHPKAAPHERITFTRKALLSTKHLILHCYGADKKHVLDAAAEAQTYRPYPIQGFMNQSTPLTVFWTE